MEDLDLDFFRRRNWLNGKPRRVINLITMNEVEPRDQREFMLDNEHYLIDGEIDGEKNEEVVADHIKALRKLSPLVYDKNRYPSKNYIVYCIGKNARWYVYFDSRKIRTVSKATFYLGTTSERTTMEIRLVKKRIKKRKVDYVRREILIGRGMVWLPRTEDLKRMVIMDGRAFGQNYLKLAFVERDDNNGLSIFLIPEEH